jgi:glycosyltransferase involved in cell wall biosynthesis
LKIELIIHCELDPNAGGSGVTLRLRDEYIRLGHEARIYSYSDLPRRWGLRKKQLVFPFFVARHLARETRRRRPDVVDASTADTWLWSLVDHARRRVVLATTSHGLEHLASDALRDSERAGAIKLSWKYPLYYGGLHLREVAASLRRADVSIFLNRVDRDYAVDELGVTRARTAVVPNGIGERYFGLPLQPTPGHGAVGIAQVGSYIDRKGVSYSGPALAAALRKYPDAFVSLLGTGSSRDDVLAHFDSSLHDRINVVPHYENDTLPELLAAHQIVLFPTLSEGFGVALLEAMACGLAPVSTAASGPSEFVRDGENGVLVPLRDSAALADAIGRLIEDRDLLDRLRHEAHATAQAYTWGASAELRLSAYEAALGARAR